MSGKQYIKAATTERLILWQMTDEDAPLILELLNEPLFHRFIGDKGVRNLDDAIKYLRTGPIASYAEHGFGLFLVERKADHVAVGMCGLLKRTSMEDVEIGFALLARYSGQGYATEAGLAVMQLGREKFALKRIAAIADIDNEASANVLRKIGLQLRGTIKLPELDSERRFFLRTDAP
ncbi:MAG TPA: GNAT family N-acetyltransferase [Steroidobacteraceae bacterium]|nr:GNAT family N-acetyltransferase [Steroidobacteraceae bacterium]